MILTTMMCFSKALREIWIFSVSDQIIEKHVSTKNLYIMLRDFCLLKEVIIFSLSHFVPLLCWRIKFNLQQYRGY